MYILGYGRLIKKPIKYSPLDSPNELFKDDFDDDEYDSSESDLDSIISYSDDESDSDMEEFIVPSEEDTEYIESSEEEDEYESECDEQSYKNYTSINI